MLPNPNMKISTFSSEFLPKSCLVKGNEVKLATSKLILLASTMPTFSHSNISSNIINTTTNNKLATMWREIQGSRNWENLVNPLDTLLQEEIIRYGEFVVACYNAFDLDPNSKRYLNCKYGKNSMLSEVGLGKSGYQITKYIYATTNINVLSIGQNSSSSSSGRWIGYVAISSDEETKRLGRRDVLITFRGTVTNPEWIANLMSTLSPARLDPSNLRPEVKVEAGFLSLYTSNEGERFGLRSCREQLLSEIGRVINMYKNEEMSITIGGHSMGSALALLLAYDIAELGLNKNATTTRCDQLYESSVSESESNNISITVFSFGGPRVGNSGFKERCEELGVKVLRIVNVNDPITKLPGVLLNENFRIFGGRYEVPWSCSCYAHVGVEILLDFFNMQNPSCVHDLGTYLNLLKSHHHHKSLQVQREEEEDIDFFNIAKEFFLSMLYYGEFLPFIW